VTDIATRIAALDWPSIGSALDERGFATISALLTTEECRDLASSYPIGVIFHDAA
jgi:hypothetical protein